MSSPSRNSHRSWWNFTGRRGRKKRRGSTLAYGRFRFHLYDEKDCTILAREQLGSVEEVRTSYEMLERSLVRFFRVNSSKNRAVPCGS